MSNQHWWAFGLISILVPSPAVADGDQEWPMYGHDPHRSFTNLESGITPQNAAELAPVWTFATGDVVTVQPVVRDEVVYFGSWDGYFYAIDLYTGTLRWKFQVDCDDALSAVPPQCVPRGQVPPPRSGNGSGLITSSALVEGGRVYFGGGRTVYCLKARTGELIWKRQLCGNPDDPSCEADAADPAQIYSSPAYGDGRIFIGVSANQVPGYRGAIIAVDARDGKIDWRFETDPILDGSGNPILGENGLPIGGLNRGCGGVWSSGTVDRAHHLVFFGTSDCANYADPPYHEAELALDTKSGRLRWAFRRGDDPHGCDYDFGATANLIDLDGEHLLGVGGKDATYYMLDRLTHDPAGALVWKTNVVFGGRGGGFYGGAVFDGQRIISTTGIGDFEPGQPLCDPTDPRDQYVQDPSLYAFDAVTGAVLWTGSRNYSFAATSAGDGVTFAEFGGYFGPPAINVFDSATGALLTSLPLPGPTNTSPPIAVHGMVVIGTGDLVSGQSGGIAAFSL